MKKVRKAANCRAAGPDGVRGYWFKWLTSLQTNLTSALQKCLNEGNIPEWQVRGRMILIQKDSTKGTVASNYRSIACLPLMWKLLTGLCADMIYDHLLNLSLWIEKVYMGCSGNKGSFFNRQDGAEGNEKVPEKCFHCLHWLQKKIWHVSTFLDFRNDWYARNYKEYRIID